MAVAAGALLVAGVLLLAAPAPAGGFVRVDGTAFVGANGSALYFSGFNAHWMMLVASEGPAGKGKVAAAMSEAAAAGMNVARTWAFSDGGQRPLQSLPGSYNEAMFQGLDFTVAEAARHGVLLILSLVNSYSDYGGRAQYMRWTSNATAAVAGEDDDEFYTDAAAKKLYKNHVEAVLTRVNTVTGVAYKDEPAILAWELINEPRCAADPSGDAVRNWIAEMAAHVKSIDKNHLLEVGMEGFYGGEDRRRELNPGGTMYGTDFISGNAVPDVDFATIHAYPAAWFSNSSEEWQLEYLENWTAAHTEDAGEVLGKPLLLTEFGRAMSSNATSAAAGAGARDKLLQAACDGVYTSAAAGNALAGGLFWQLLPEGLDELRDGYEIAMNRDTSAADVIRRHSLRLAAVSRKVPPAS